MQKGQKKQVMRLHKGDRIKLPFFSEWCTVVGDPWNIDGHVWAAIMLPGFKFTQLFKFDWRDDFEYDTYQD